MIDLNLHKVGVRRDDRGHNTLRIVRQARYPLIHPPRELSKAAISWKPLWRCLRITVQPQTSYRVPRKFRRTQHFRT
jgi:hypothetical protein